MERMTQIVALTVLLTQYFSLLKILRMAFLPFGCFPGNLIPRHQELFCKNPLFAGMRLPEVKEAESLDRRYPNISASVLDLAKVSNRSFWKFHGEVRGSP